MIEERFAELRPLFGGADQQLFAEIKEAFAPPAFRNAPTDAYDAFYAADPVFRAWADRNLTAHRNDQYAIVTVSVKAHGATPGDATSAQMRVLADLAERHGHGDLRISHEQNVILPHVHKSDLPAVHAALVQAGLGTANIGLASDIIACPGMDYCSLATARSIPVAQELALRLREVGLEEEVGPLKIKISGCINACGHHHVGHIGILGLDRAGVENYQITLGGDGTEDTVIGDKTGPGFAYTEVVGAVERILRTYLGLRLSVEETFLQAFKRVGMEPFKAALYDEASAMPRDLHQGPVAERVAALNARYRHHSATAVLEHALKDDDLGRVALVSSFGAESVVLLHLVSVIAPETPVLFIDTRMLFAETLEYQRQLAESLHLCDVRTIRAPQPKVAFEDPDGTLHQFNTDACCAVRKVEPLERALAGSTAGSRAQAVSERRPRGAAVL